MRVGFPRHLSESEGYLPDFSARGGCGGLQWGIWRGLLGYGKNFRGHEDLLWGSLPGIGGTLCTCSGVANGHGEVAVAR